LNSLFGSGTTVALKQRTAVKKAMIEKHKQSAARSGTEQAADLSKLFTLLKKYGIVTPTPEMTPLKRDLIAATDDVQDIVILPASHMAAFIDFLISLPGVLTSEGSN